MEARPKRVVAIVNPSKPRSVQAIEAVRQLCLSAGWQDPLVLETSVVEPGASQATMAVAAHADIVLAAGGDGTVREVATILGGTGIPLGVVPLGTGNLFARNLRLPLGNLERCIRIALFGDDRRIDTGRILFTGPDEGDRPRDSVFLVVAGFGMDANAFATTSAAQKERIGWFAYFDSLARNLFWAGDDVCVALDGEEPETLTLWSVMVANCGRIPARLTFVPRAEPDDGKLDLVIMSPRTPADWIPIAGKILLRTPFEIPALSYRRATSVRIRPRIPIAMHLDGDVFPAITEAIIHIAPGTLVVRSLPAARERWPLGARARVKMPPAPPYT